MSFSFYAQDNEFAAATGANVGATSTSSRFDYPTDTFTSLAIAENDGDGDPRLFEVGDTYDLTWQDGSGANSIQDAVVLRSDDAPGSGGIIVFEGIDESGGLTQIIWTPGFDLSQWYADNYVPYAPPGFYTVDQNAEYSHKFVCFGSKTGISTPYGYVPAADLTAGDLVDTLDNGSQPLRWVGKTTIGGHGAAAPVRFAAGALGNKTTLFLSQNHRVLLRSEKAELYFETSEVLVPAKVLINGRGIHIAPRGRITYVHFLLENHEIVLADGVWCESLYPGEVARHILSKTAGTDPDDVLQETLTAYAGHPPKPARPLLTAREARALADTGRVRTAPVPVPVAI